MSSERPKAGQLEERDAPALAVEGKKIRGRIPYSVESRDMGGWREIIEPTALRGTKLDDLVATIDHTGVPIGRYPTTLDLEERADGLHWSVSPPESRADVREAIQRGDLKAGSWRMVVKRDEWRGDVRHVHEIAELRDVSVVSHPSYPASTVEGRTARRRSALRLAGGLTAVSGPRRDVELRHPADGQDAGGRNHDDPGDRRDLQQARGLLDPERHDDPDEAGRGRPDGRSERLPRAAPDPDGDRDRSQALGLRRPRRAGAGGDRRQRLFRRRARTTSSSRSASASRRCGRRDTTPT